MVCTHLRELYQLCETNQLKLSGSDLIRIICTQCQQEDTCPSVLMEHYEATEETPPHPTSESKPAPPGASV